MRARAMKRRHRSATGREPTIPGDQAILRRLASSHLQLQLLFLLWEKTEGDDFAVLWAATGLVVSARPKE